MIRILHVIHNLRTGGAERMLSDLVPLLEKYPQLENHVAVLRSPGELEPRIIDSRIPLRRFDRRRFFDPGILINLKRIIAEQRIDVLHMHDFSAVYWGSLASLGSSMLARVITHHNVEGWHGGVLKTAKRRLFKRTIEPMIDRHIAVCRAVAERLEQDSVDSGKAVVIYNGIDINRFGRHCGRDETRRFYGLNADLPLVGMVGRCSKEKGGEVFLASLKILKERGVAVQALIAGDGPRLNSWRELSNSMGLDSVRFSGHVPHQGIPDLMGCIDAAVIPSHAEALSIAAIEFMSSGVPVIAADVGGNAEVIADGVTGFIVPPNRPEQLAERIIEIIGDNEGVRKMRSASKERARRMFSAEGMARSYNSMYNELFSCRRCVAPVSRLMRADPED